MLRGVIFDLGHTLIEHEYGQNWACVRPRMVTDLTAFLSAQFGSDFDAARFSETFDQELDKYDRQRRTELVEITAEYVLRSTFARLALEPPRPPGIAEAVRAFFRFSETLWFAAAGVHELLAGLRASGLKLALVSNAIDDANVQRLIDNHALREYFDPIVVSAAAAIRKPNPAIFAPVMAAWAVPPDAIAVVGDTLGADVLGAINAGMRSIWLGVHAERPDNVEHAKHLQPDIRVERLAEAPAALQTLGAQLRSPSRSKFQ